MNPETKPLRPSSSQPVGSVVSLPSDSDLIQFIGHRQTCGFPKSSFRQSDFILTEICRQHPNRAPQELRLIAPGVTVTLVGWRLDLLPERLAGGKINGIRAMNHASAGLAVEEPLVCCIRIYWSDSTRSITLLPPRAHRDSENLKTL